MAPVQTTTLPVNPIRLGQQPANNQPIRRRALVPAQQALPPAEEENPETEEQAAGPGDEGDDNDDQTQNPETDVAAEAQQQPAAPVEPARRGRGRPRKADVAPVAASTSKRGKTLRSEVDADMQVLGQAAIASLRLGLTLTEYVDSIRGTVEAYDRAVARTE